MMETKTIQEQDAQNGHKTCIHGYQWTELVTGDVVCDECYPTKTTAINHQTYVHPAPYVEPGPSGKFNGKFPLRLGHIKADLIGGPYRNKTAEFYGIKMAEEINADCVINIPTEDYCVPDTGRLVAGLYCGISLAQQQAPLWVGCMGGIGRTGLYFGALAKVMARYQKFTKQRVTIDPVKYVRKHYLAHAIETPEQIAWLKALNVDEVARWAAAINGYKPPWWRRFI